MRTMIKDLRRRLTRRPQPCACCAAELCEPCQAEDAREANTAARQQNAAAMLGITDEARRKAALLRELSDEDLIAGVIMEAEQRAAHHKMIVEAMNLDATGLDDCGD